MKRVILAIALVSLFVIPYLANAKLNIEDKDLLLYLPFNGDTDDFSVNGNHGELVGNADFDEGQHGEAIVLSEAGEVKAPYIPLNERSFSICMWVRPESAGALEQCVFSQMQANATNTSMHFRIYTHATVRMGFYSNDLDAPGAVQAGKWAHICFWFDIDDGQSRKNFINGEQVAQDSGRSAYLGNAGNTMIGSWSTSGQKFNGAIDEVQI